jgi:hypothetical protein
MINKFRVKNFIVPRLGTAVPAPGDRLWDLATDALNQPVGGFGVYQPVAGSGNPEATALAPTIATAPSIKFILRRDKDQDRTPLRERTFEMSPEIEPNCQLRATGTAASVKNNGCWLTGAVTGSGLGEVPVNDETEYIVNAASHGWRTDLTNGYNTPLKQGRYTTPDYFSDPIYTTLVQQRDHLLMNLAYDFNNQSQQDILCLCLDAAATASTVGTNVVNLTAILALSPGDQVVVGFTDAGQPIRLTLDTQLLAMFDELVNTYGLPGTVQVVPYARPTATNLGVATRIVAGGRAAATPDSQVDHLLFIHLNHKQASYDEVSQTKERLKVGLEGGFEASTANEEAVAPEEGSGYAEDLLQQYQDLFSKRVYPGSKNWQPNSVDFHNEIVPGAIYDVYIIESCENRIASSGLNSTSPQKTIIALQNTEIAGFTGFTGAPNPQKAYLEGIINAWMNSTTFAHTNISL